jgi:hypothetical protein
MKILLKYLLILGLAGCPLVSIFGQEAVLSADGDATGAGGSVSWSVGQVSYSTWAAVSGTATEGVQQPYEIYIMIGIEEVDSDPGCIIFPNPTSGNVSLKFFQNNFKDFNYILYDLNGKSLRRGDIDKAVVSISMEDLNPDTYFLVLSGKDQAVKTYKIIKQ